MPAMGEREPDTTAVSPVRKDALPRHVAMVLEATMGGTRTHLLQLARGLPRERFQLTLILSAERDRRFRQVMEQLRREGVHVVEVPMLRRIAPVRDSIAMLRILRALRAIPWDVVHTHASKGGAVGRLAARVCVGLGHGGRIAHTPHTFPFEGRGRLARWFFRAIERRLARRTDRLIVLSEGQRRLAVNEVGMPPDRVAFIPNGVDADHFASAGRRASARNSLGLATDAPVVGWIGRFMPQKRCDAFIRAAARVRERLPETRFLIVGEGPLERDLRRLARRLGVAPAVTWHGFVDDPRPFYEAMDVFVLTSRYEGMPYSLLEAMAMELPVVASDIAGCEDVVTPENGILVPAGWTEGFGEAIVGLLEEPSRRIRMGKAGRARVAAEFTPARFIKATASLYESLIG